MPENTEKRFLKETYLKWFKESPVTNPVAVTLTLKQGVESKGHAGRFYFSLKDYDVSQNIRHFMNRMNQKCLGKKYSRFGERLSVIPVVEGDSEVRTHVHLALEKPPGFEIRDYEGLICECWEKTKFGYENIQVDPMHDYMGWIDYIMKSKSKSGDIHSSTVLEQLFLRQY